MVTILLADDHDVVRLGVRALLQAEPDFCLVSEVADGLQVMPEVERLRPQVVVLDLMMPGLNGFEVMRRALKHAPQTRIVVLSMQGNEAYVYEALRIGAAAYVLKGSSATELVHAIREVMAGRSYLSPPLSEQSIKVYAEKAAGAPLDLYETLTSREREVLQLAAEGQTSAAIATRMFISARTVESHRASLSRKLDLHSQTELVRYALRRGILLLDD